jgi:chorismate mutase
MGDETLLQLRTRLDELNADLVRSLAERFQVTRAIGEHKAASGLPSADLVREAEQQSTIRVIAEDSGVPPELCEQIFRLIVDEVVRQHARIAASERSETASGGIAHQPALTGRSASI